MTTKTLKQKLFEIQQTLEVKKNHENKFGGFLYRNLEDILKAVKPLLKEQGCILIFSDQAKEVGKYAYIESHVQLGDMEHDEFIITKGTAGIAEHAKMSLGQCFGTAKSYARKEAACGLFCIDDGVDDDVVNKSPQPPSKPSYEPKKTESPQNFDFGSRDSENRDQLNKIILEMNEGDENRTREYLESITTFMGDNGQVPGVTGVNQLKDKRLYRTLMTAKKDYEEWKSMQVGIGEDKK